MLVRIRWKPGEYAISIPVDEPGEEKHQRVLIDVKELAKELTKVYGVQPVVSLSRLALTLYVSAGADCQKYINRLVFLVEAHLEANQFLLRALPPKANKFGGHVVTERLWYLSPLTSEVDEALRLQKEIDDAE